MCYDGDISFVPGLEAWLNSLLRDKLLCHFVLPDGWVKRFTDQPDGLEVSHFMCSDVHVCRWPAWWFDPLSNQHRLQVSSKLHVKCCQCAGT